MISNPLGNISIRIVSGLCLAFIIMGGVFVPLKVSLAQDKPTEYTPLTTIPGAFKQGDTTTNPVDVIKNIYSVSIGIAAILAVGIIIWAGVEYATVESLTGKSDAKDMWQGAIWGLVLLLSSYLILRTINVDLVNINLDLGNPAVGEKASRNSLTILLDTVNEQATRAIAEEKQAGQKLQDAQKSLANLKTEKEELETVIAQEHDAQKISELRQRITSLSNEIAPRETAIKTLENAKSVASLSTTQTQVGQQSVQAIQSGGGITNAQAIAASGAANVASLKANGADPEVIKKAEEQLKATNFTLVQASKAIDIINYIKKKKEGTVDEKRAFEEMEPEVIEKREAFIVSLQAINTINDASVKALTEPALVAQKNALDREIAKQKGCPTGHTVQLFKSESGRIIFVCPVD